MSSRWDRRFFIKAAAVALAGVGLSGWTRSREVRFGTPASGMKPGDYAWAPERGPDGPLALIVSLPEQRAYVYRGGTLIGVATCSTGRKGHRTPTGVFTVLQKDRDHVSSTYKGAKMPFMERLTWSGIALHAGNLPGYPASHGCIRLPYDFAKKLFQVSHLGVAVIIADQHSEPVDVVHPGFVLPNQAADEIRSVVAGVKQRKLPPMRRHEHGRRPAKVVISVADRTVQIFEDGHLRHTGPLTVKGSGGAIGDHLFVLRKAHGNGTTLVWTAISYGGPRGSGRLAKSEAAVIDRLSTDTATAHALQKLMHPGFKMVITDSPAPPASRSVRNFAILTHPEPEDWRTKVYRN